MPDVSLSPGLQLIIECLSQNIGELEWLKPLKMHTEKKLPTNWAAIGFDTNALKQLRRYPPATRSSILTYLQGESVPIILPAQSVQEYWNNHGIFTKDVLGLENETKRLASKYEKLQGGASSKILLDRIAAQVYTLAADVADSQNPHLLKESIDLWDLLLADSTTAHVPRERILRIGEARFASGIAPGFADESKKANRLGDFFVWADFLMGLQAIGLASPSTEDSSIVFVTDDGKEDWIASGVPHPTLLGEIFHLTGKPLEILTMEQLKKIVQA
ncbi:MULTISPECIES: PIN-like domain-containing protein [unclassified Cryobacterium]|uniref:PIN-like domain-containing protein n=1 Tax=unclassified Cryobacterium TaxID=2649013 RepID=UPI000CE56292|nr:MULTISPECIES: PIN-like domain-containing protein [unclassified Cryobacterium]